MLRFLRSLFLFLVASFVLAGGVYVNTQSFHERWHGFVTGELMQHGVHLEGHKGEAGAIGDDEAGGHHVA